MKGHCDAQQILEIVAAEIEKSKLLKVTFSLEYPAMDD